MAETNDQQQEQKKIDERMASIKNTVLVLSGKGGVGKSTVAVNLAASLAKAGNRVGLLDVDIHGPSVPGMLGLDGHQAFYDGSSIVPMEFTPSFQIMSINFLLNDTSEAVIWRGPMKYHVIRQFIGDVAWGELDYLVVDCPPGTGDEPLSVAQLVSGKHPAAVLVTTPQRVSVDDVRKSAKFSDKLELNLLGIIENMSGFVCPHCGNLTNIFDAGGGEMLAKELDVPLLGRVPIEPSVVKACDAGKPIVTSTPDSESAKSFLAIAESVDKALKG